MVGDVGGPSVLTAGSFSFGGSLRGLVVSRMQEAFAERVKKESEADADISKTIFDRSQEEIGRFSEQKSRLSSVSRTLDTNLTNVKTMKQALFDMKVIVEHAGSSTDVAYMAKKFDLAFEKLNDAADMMPKGFNLIGNTVRGVWRDPEVRYQRDVHGGETTINGRYVGSDYYITDTNGNRWVPNFGTRSLEKWGPGDYPPSTGDTPADEVMMADGVDGSVAADDSTTFTIYPGNAARTQVITGTVTRGGLGVLNAWAYKGLDDAAARTQALSDIEEARAKVSAVEASLSAEKGRVGARVRDISSNMDAVTDDTVSKMRDAYMAQATKQLDMQERYKGMVANLKSMMATQYNANMLLGSVKDKLAGLLVDNYA